MVMSYQEVHALRVGDALMLTTPSGRVKATVVEVNRAEIELSVNSIVGSGTSRNVWRTRTELREIGTTQVGAAGDQPAPLVTALPPHLMALVH